MTDRHTTARHELAHALVGRAVGQTIRLVVTTPERAFTEHDPPDQPDSLDTIADDIVTLLAGNYATLALGDRTGGYAEPPDDCEAATTAALDRLPADDAGFLRYVLSSEGSRYISDGAKVDALALRATEYADERGAFIAYCSARAWRLVTTLLPTIDALVPLALAHPVLTGDELEAGIAALAGQEGT